MRSSISKYVMKCSLCSKQLIACSVGNSCFETLIGFFFPEYLFLWASNKVLFVSRGLLLFCVTFPPNVAFAFPFCQPCRRGAFPCCLSPGSQRAQAFEAGRWNRDEQFAKSNWEPASAVISQLHLCIYNGACPRQTGLCARSCSRLVSHSFQSRRNLPPEAPVF